MIPLHFLKFLLKADSRIVLSKNRRFLHGFTMIEILVVIVIVGVLIAIAAPAWLGFIGRQNVNAARGQIFRALNESKSKAKRDQLGYQVSFRTAPVNGQETVQWVVHKSDILSKPTNAAGWNALPWQNFDPSVGMARISSGADFNRAGLDNELFTQETSALPSIVRRIRFDSKGRLDDPLSSTITVKSITGGQRGCVTVTTLLGAIRLLSEGDGAACD